MIKIWNWPQNWAPLILHRARACNFQKIERERHSTFPYERWARAQANFLSALKLWIILLYIFFSNPLKASSFERERKFSPGLSMDYEEDTLSDNQILMMLCYRYRMGPSPKACHGLRGGIWRPTSGSKAPGFQDSKVPGFQNSKVPRHWNLTCTMHMILYGEVF